MRWPSLLPLTAAILIAPRSCRKQPILRCGLWEEHAKPCQLLESYMRGRSTAVKHHAEQEVWGRTLNHGPANNADTAVAVRISGPGLCSSRILSLHLGGLSFINGKAFLGRFRQERRRSHIVRTLFGASPQSKTGAALKFKARCSDKGNC